ncbi:MAG TPA: hypothetical protein VGQ83_09030 [Polyangia bacterium]|jgi:hypothetical protein
MSALSRDGLYDAMANRRTFATSDKNATSKMLAGTCWMGSILTHAPASMAITVEATDPDAGDDFTTIELFGPARSALGSQACSGTTCTAAFTVAATAATYVVARATQTDGQYLVSAPIWLAP